VLLDPEAVSKLGKPGEETKPGDIDPQFKTRIEGLVASAVGLKKERGDQIHIELMPFVRPDVADGDSALKLIERREIIASIFKYGLPSIFLLIFFLWVVRPFIRWITTNTTDRVVQKELPQT